MECDSVDFLEFFAALVLNQSLPAVDELHELLEGLFALCDVPEDGRNLPEGRATTDHAEECADYVTWFILPAC